MFNDNGYDGLIIKIQIGGVKIDEDRMTAGAGVLLSQLVNESANKGLSGLEWAVGIPGTIGGAVNGNAGAYGRSVSESADEIIVLAEEGGEWEREKIFQQRLLFLSIEKASSNIWPIEKLFWKPF